MKNIGYVLQYFPGVTDTFIRREIRSLQNLGVKVDVISVWKPKVLRSEIDSVSQWSIETTPDVLSDWAHETNFVLPASPLFIIITLLASFLRSPIKFLATLHFAFLTARPGVLGLAYQLIYFVQAILVAAVVRRKSIDHMHNHIGDNGGTVTMLSAKFTGIGYSITFHGWPVFFDASNSQIKEKVLRAKFTRSISYFCRSQLMMFSECEDPSLFKIVHCGIDIQRYPFRTPRQEIKRLFSSGRLAPEKGHCFLIRALKSLLDQGYDLELGLAGDGPSKEGLQTLVRELGVEHQTKFLGFLSEEQIIRQLQDADLFVLPSFVEGVPVSAMEAMAMGVPVIATNVGGTSELVENGTTGLLVRPADSHALADAVMSMIDDYQFRKRAAELGRRKVECEFNLVKETEKLKSYFLQNSA
jgi:colanic acid/amylovoran biosynthesis glycosyltransferase